MTINTEDILANFDEPQGITLDPTFSNLLVANDRKDSNPTGEIYEISMAGDLLDTFELADLSGFTDPEGLSFDPVEKLLFVAFDNDEAIGIFAFEATDPEADPPEYIPLPAGMWLMLGGLGALGLARRRKT